MLGVTRQQLVLLRDKLLDLVLHAVVAHRRSFSFVYDCASAIATPTD
jgi:hypothetical protein